MSYTSYSFALLIAAGLLIYYKVLPKRGSGVLLLMSLVFMTAAGGVRTLICLTAASGIAFFCARFIARRRLLSERDKAARIVLFLSIAVLLLSLICFKYLNAPAYTVEAFYELTGRAGEFYFEPISIAAPVGISFYTLMLLSYLLDVWNGDREMLARTEKANLTEFLLYSCYFGHLLQGPIDRFSDVEESLKREHRFDAAAFQSGMLRILYGLFQKFVISERLAVLVDAVYADPSYYAGGYALLAVFAYALQLYTVFAGCIDIVLGVSGLFGVRLSENFRMPYFSESIAEFWRRWHITLGAFFRRYVYIPLGGNRKGRMRQYLNVTIVFLLSGIWHGGKWTFIIGTGLLHSAYMIAGALLAPLFLMLYRLTGIRQNAEFMVWLRRLRTFILAAIGFAIFRADSLTQAGKVLFGVFSGDASPFTAEGYLSMGLSAADSAVLALGLLTLFLVSLRREYMTDKVVAQGSDGGEEQRLKQSRKAGSTRELVLCFLLFLIVLVFGFYGSGYNASAFIYSAF